MTETQNKDIRLLRNVHAIEAELDSLEARRDRERARLNRVTRNLSLTPSGGSGAQTMDEAFAQLEKVVVRHAELIERYYKLIVRAENILSRIEDQNIRTLVRRLYMDNAPAAKVQRELKMSRWKFENIRFKIEQAERMREVEW